MEKNKRRWKKKIGGDDYEIDNKDPDSTDGFNMYGMNDELEPLANIASLAQDHEYMRRKELIGDKYAVGTVSDAGVGQIATSHDHRRKRFDDLKSVEQRKKEQQVNEVLMRSF